MAEESSSGGLSGATGWFVIGLVVFLLLVVPGFLLFSTPRDIGSYGLYVALAMLPALAFGAVGIWTALRNR